MSKHEVIIVIIVGSIQLRYLFRVLNLKLDEKDCKESYIQQLATFGCKWGDSLPTSGGKHTTDFLVSFSSSPHYNMVYIRQLNLCMLIKEFDNRAVLGAILILYHNLFPLLLLSCFKTTFVPILVGKNTSNKYNMLTIEDSIWNAWKYVFKLWNVDQLPDAKGASLQSICETNCED